MSDGIFDWEAIEWESEQHDYIPFVADAGINNLQRWLASPEGQRAARVAAFDRELA